MVLSPPRPGKAPALLVRIATRIVQLSGLGRAQPAQGSISVRASKAG